MEDIGLERHQRARQRFFKADDGTITDGRIATSRERVTAVFGARPRARSLREASPESEWVARHVEWFGHEVIVANPNDGPMYANRSRDTRRGGTCRGRCDRRASRPRRAVGGGPLTGGRRLVPHSRGAVAYLPSYRVVTRLV